MDGLETPVQIPLRKNLTKTRSAVTVLIVTFHSRDWIGRCLDSLYDTAGELISGCHVVDNASGDGCADLIRDRYPQVRLTVQKENLGFSKGINRAAVGAAGDFLLVLNPDTILRPGALEELVKFLEHRPAAAVCGPQILGLDGKPQFQARRGFPTPLNAAAYMFGLDHLFPGNQKIAGYARRGLSFDQEMLTDVLTGACMLVRKRDFVTVGGFDEDYFLFGEDIDFCWKLRSAGREVWYVPSAVVQHAKGHSMGSAPGVAGREFYRAMRIYMNKRLEGVHGHTSLAVAKMGVRLAEWWSCRGKIRHSTKSTIANSHSEKDGID